MKVREKRDIGDLVELMARLRGEGGCPWDREQDARSLTPYIIEEAYELVEAIQEGDPDHIREELGDLLFQIVFQARLGEEDGVFNMGDVIAGIDEKMRRRHPHVFGDISVRDSADVKKNWARIKEEQEGKKKAPTVLGKTARGLPALLRARRLTENAREAGFDWRSWEEVAEKFEEEWDELRESVAGGGRAEIEDELGDVLFVLVNLSRFLEVDPERALNGASAKFVRRFRHIEKRVAESGRRLEDLDIGEMESYWQEAKALGM